MLAHLLSFGGGLLFGIALEEIGRPIFYRLVLGTWPDRRGLVYLPAKEDRRK